MQGSRAACPAPCACGAAASPPQHSWARESELSILPSFTASSPKHFQPDSQSQPSLAKTGVQYEACADLG